MSRETWKCGEVAACGVGRLCVLRPGHAEPHACEQHPGGDCGLVWQSPYAPEVAAIGQRVADMSEEPVDLPESTVTRIAALMRKAKSTDSPHEAAAFERKVSNMIAKRNLVTWGEE